MKTGLSSALALVLAFGCLAGAYSQDRGGDLGSYAPLGGRGPAISAFAYQGALAALADGASPASGSDATSGATAAAAPPPARTFLGFPSKTSFHRFSGWMAGGLLLAAGVVGGIHLLDMIDKAHAQRDALGIEDFNAATCQPIIQSVYGDSTEQALRWVHVGLLGAGEVFYLANAFTGTGMMGPLEPGWTPRRIHRYAFFAHLGLMVAEGVAGVILSDALSRGDHEVFSELGPVHAAIGIAIPVVILGAGIVMDGQ